MNRRQSTTESGLESAFLVWWMQQFPGFPPQLQYFFHPSRKWRFDFCWPQFKWAVEIQGYGPGHNSLRGMTNDYNKLMGAYQVGWRVIYLTKLHLTPEKAPSVCQDIAKLMGIRVTPQVGYVPFRKRKFK